MHRTICLAGIGAPSAWRLLVPAVVAVTVAASNSAAVGAGLEDAQELFDSGKYEECAQRAATEIKNGVYGETWLLWKIRADLALGNYEEALETAEYGLDGYRFSSSVPLRLLAHTVYRYNGQSARARTELDMLERLVMRNPRSFSSSADRVNLGRLFLIKGADARQVLELFYDPVAKQRPSYAEAFLASAELALSKHDNALAAELLDSAPESAHDGPHYHYLRARAFASDDAELASEALNKALEINPRHIESLLMRVDSAVDAEQYGEAETLLDEILKINRRHPVAWAYRAVLAHLAEDGQAEFEARSQALSCWVDNPEVDHTIGRKLSEKYRFAEGAAYQGKALRFDASYVPARIQLSQDLLRLGQEDEGWKAAHDVYEADGYNVVAHNLVTLHDTVTKYRVLSDDSFRVRMESREAALYGDRVLDLLHRAKATLCEKYDVDLEAPITVEIFPEQKDFAVRTFGMPGVQGFLGVCFGNVITANSPAALGETSANWESVLWHEFCHVVTLHKTRNKMPRWMSEGISVYEELQEDPTWGQIMTPQYRQMILELEMPPVSQLSSSFLTPKSPLHLQFAYFQSSLVVEYLVETYGLEALRQTLDDLGAGRRINDALQRNFAPLARIDAGFAEFARGRADNLAPELTWDECDLPPDADVDAIEAWLEDHPRNFEGLVRLALALQRNEQWQDSLEPASQLRDLFPSYVASGNGYQLLARAYRGLGDVAEERESLESWAARDNDAAAAYVRLMELAEETDDWTALRQNARRHLAVNPLIPAPHRSLAKAAGELGLLEEAVAAHRALLQFDTGDPVAAHFQLAQLLQQLGDVEQARREAVMALEDAPRFLAAHRLLLDLADGQAEREEASPVEWAESEQPTSSDSTDASDGDSGDVLATADPKTDDDAKLDAKVDGDAPADETPTPNADRQPDEDAKATEADSPQEPPQQSEQENPASAPPAADESNATEDDV